MSLFSRSHATSCFAASAGVVSCTMVPPAERSCAKGADQEVLDVGLLAAATVSSGFFFAAMMPLSDGYRGSFRPVIAMIKTGVCTSTICLPSSVSR